MTKLIIRKINYAILATFIKWVVPKGKSFVDMPPTNIVETDNTGHYQGNWRKIPSRFSARFLKDPQRLTNFYGYIDTFIFANGYACLGRRGSLEDCFTFPYKEAWLALCEPIIHHPLILNTSNKKGILMTFSLISAGTGNDVIFKALVYVQKKYYNFGNLKFKIN